jgi:hypothetical protein
MALLAMEGFDGGGTIDSDMVTYLERRYSDTYLSTSYLDNITGRFSGRGIKLWGGRSFKIPVVNKQTVIIGFALKCENWAICDTEAIIEFYDGATLQGELQAITGGNLRVTRSDNITLGTTSGLNLLNDTWYYIELKMTIDNTAGAFELRAGGINVLSDTAIDTQVTGNAYVNTISFYGDESSMYFGFDDIYILDTTGSVNNNFLGNQKITMISPDALGSSANFTPSAGDNFENIDEGVTVDDDTTYNESATAAHKDLVNYSAAADLGVIAGVQVATECRETDATNYTLKTVVKSGGTESDDTAQNMGSTYTSLKRLVELDPNTSAPWTLINLNAAEFGYKVG